MKKIKLAIFWISALFSCANALAQAGVGIGTTSPTALIHMLDGHIRSEQSAGNLPTLAVTSANGITGAAFDTSTSNPTDIKGTINLTGTTSGGATIATVTVTLKSIFTVPPTVAITPVNAAGAAYSYFSTSSITGGVAQFTLNIYGSNATNPSFNYIVIE